MADASFDVVSKVDKQEVSNALTQARKEISQRYDFKNVGASIEWSGENILIKANSHERVLAVLDVFQTKLVKRGVSLKSLKYEKLEPAMGKSVRQKITLQQGIPSEKAKEIVRLIKDSKKKVQASIQGDTVRITGKDRDTLQETIALLKGHDFGIDMQFTNYRSN